MAEIQESRSPSSARGWLLSGVVVLAALVMAAAAIHHAVTYPRTDDAEVFANFIGIAPQVEGPITNLAVHDNELVPQGALLFEIDDRPYRYALENARSQQASLAGDIEDKARSIAAQRSAVNVAAANASATESSSVATAAAVTEAKAEVANAQAAIQRAEAERQYAQDNLNRLEPLLQQQFVTVDQVDLARTDLETKARAVEQTRAQLAQAQAGLASEVARLAQAHAAVLQSAAEQQQAAHAILTLAPLENQRGARQAAIELAQYNLNNCRVYAPFPALVTNLTISQGEYAHIGQQVFLLIDNRTWWVIANFRETQLHHVHVGARADVFLLSQQNRALHGTVESIGYGVSPDPSILGTLTPGLPDVQRTLSWVHLAARYPVRIRIDNPPPGLLRIGQNAVAVVYPDPAAGR
jgi:membrane fusion protein, multidrug efflux system